MFPSDVDSWDNLGNTCRQLRNLNLVCVRAPTSLGLLETFEKKKTRSIRCPYYVIFKRTDSPSQGREYDPILFRRCAIWLRTSSLFGPSLSSFRAVNRQYATFNAIAIYILH